MGFDIEFSDFSAEILAEFEAAKAKTLEKVGARMESHVAAAAPVGTPTSTSVQNYHGGALKESITHKVIDDTVYVGTNMKAPPTESHPEGAPYPVYVELGTGVYAEGGKGRQSPWTWCDKNGDFHHTHGIKPTHFMRNALQSQDHVEEYKAILEEMAPKKGVF